MWEGTFAIHLLQAAATIYTLRGCRLKLVKSPHNSIASDFKVIQG